MQYQYLYGHNFALFSYMSEACSLRLREEGKGVSEHGSETRI